MKPTRFFVLVALLFALPTLAATPTTFDRYFEDATLRVDYVHVGNAEEEWIAIDRIYLNQT